MSACASTARALAALAAALVALGSLGADDPAGLALAAGAAAAALGTRGRWVADAAPSKAVLLAAALCALVAGMGDHKSPAWLCAAAVAARVEAISATRVRAALVVDALVLVLLSSSGHAPGTAVVAAWVGLALLTTAALAGAEAATVPALAGEPEPASRRLARAAGALVAVLLLAPVVAALVLPPPEAGGGSLRIGDAPTATRAALYVSRGAELDVGDRPDRGDLSEEILTVRAEEPAFWRGQTFVDFDGRRWHGDGQVLGYADAGTVGGIVGWATDPDVPVERLVQRVTVRAPYLTQLVAAPDAVRLSVPAPVRRYADGSMEVVYPLGRGATYVVESLRASATADLLRAADPRRLATPLPPEAASARVLGVDVDPRVAALARELDDAAPTTYDLVRAVEAWLGANTAYTLDLLPLPPGADPVAQHLFVDRRGWCEQIATSAAVLLRLAGVPARLATGFVPGDRAAIGDEFTVRAGDAHAWVEVWFPGVGWQGFDPTADVPLAGETSSRWLDEALRVLRAIGPWLAALAVTVVAAFVAAWVVRRRRARRGRPWPVVVAEELDRAGRRRGRPRRPAETVSEYAAALASGPLPDARLVSVAAAVDAAAYGGAPPDDAAETVLADVLAAHPPPSRWSRFRGQKPGSRVETGI